jgi:sugar fermentation stimulation protein
MKELFTVDKLIKATIINRPSKIIKSPYLADILIDNKEYLAHSPSLGCSGLIVSGTNVLVSPKINTKSKYSIDVVFSNNIKVGVNPNYANHIVYNILNQNIIKELSNLEEIKKESTKNKCRFDFIAKKNNKTYYIEVKNVPLIDTEGIAIFPEGYRKKKSDTVSLRAIKHIEELENIKLSESDSESIIIFIIQRTGCKYFKPAETDPIFKKALLQAKNNGVIIKAYQVKWIDNKVYFDKELKCLI